MTTKDNLNTICKKLIGDKDISHSWVAILEELCKRYPTIARQEHGFNFLKKLAYQLYENGEIEV